MEDNIGRIVKLLQHKDGKIPKEEELGQGTHEEKNSAKVEIPSMNKHEVIKDGSQGAFNSPRST